MLDEYQRIADEDGIILDEGRLIELLELAEDKLDELPVLCVLLLTAQPVADSVNRIMRMSRVTDFFMLYTP